MRWLCYPHRSRDWTDDRFISTNFACWDKHRYRRPNIRVNTIHRSQKGCSLHEARAYAATYLHHYSRRGGRVASYRTQTAPQVWSLFLSTALPASLASFVSAVLQGFKQVGFIDSQNAAVNVSGYDAVEGSSTGPRVPRMWALLRLPRFRAAHADNHDNRSRHRQVRLPGSRR